MVDLELLRRHAEAGGFEFATPQAVAAIFGKSLESVRLQGRDGNLGRALRVDLGHATFCYPVARCFDYWNFMYPEVLAELRMTAFAFTLEHYGDLKNVPATILHTKPIISIGDRQT